jgi:hypothetical protein
LQGGRIVVHQDSQNLPINIRIHHSSPMAKIRKAPHQRNLQDLHEYVDFEATMEIRCQR